MDNETPVYVIPGGYRFVWPLEQIEITVKRITDDRRNQTTSAELTILSTDAAAPGHLHQCRLNLTASRSKDELAKTLRGHVEAVDWKSVIETVCVQTLAMHREGEPVQKVGERPIPTTYPYRLWPVVPEGQPAIIYGEGANFKSYLALYMALMVQSGKPAMGLRPTPGKSLFLDWETSAEITNERVAALCRGNNLPSMSIDYRYCYHPLSEDVEMLLNYINDNGITFVVIDSAAPACGGDPKEAELTIRMFNALRTLRVSSLILAHVSKPPAGSTEDRQTTPFGSVFFLNLARSVWEIKRVQKVRDSHLRCALYHRKCNTGPLRSALGYEVEITTDSNEHTDCCRLTRLDVHDDPTLSKRLPLGDRIRAELKHGKMTKEALAIVLGESADTIKARLYEMRGKSVVQVGAEWGLAGDDASTN